MAEIMKFHESVIMTIPGSGHINGRMILGETDGIRRFSSSTKSLAFVDLAPFVYQSGKCQIHQDVRTQLQSSQVCTLELYHKYEKEIFAN
jgi:transposase